MTELEIRAYIDELMQGVHDRINNLEAWIEELDDKLADLDDSVQFIQSDLDSMI